MAKDNYRLRYRKEVFYPRHKERLLQEQAVYSKTYSILHKEDRLFYMKDYQYGLSKEQYQEMLRQQKSSCAICSKAFKQNPCVDHDHETNKVRGLLCRKCNSLLGYAGDNVVVLKNAIAYLKRQK